MRFDADRPLSTPARSVLVRKSITVSLLRVVRIWRAETSAAAAADGTGPAKTFVADPKIDGGFFWRARI